MALQQASAAAAGPWGFLLALFLFLLFLAFVWWVAWQLSLSKVPVFREIFGDPVSSSRSGREKAPKRITAGGGSQTSARRTTTASARTKEL